MFSSAEGKKQVRQHASLAQVMRPYPFYFSIIEVLNAGTDIVNPEWKIVPVGGGWLLFLGHGKKELSLKSKWGERERQDRKMRR